MNDILFKSNSKLKLYPFSLHTHTGSRMSQNNGSTDDAAASDNAASSDLRLLYRKLLFQTKEKRSELVRPESTGLLETLEEMNVLFSRVKNPREAVYDSNVLKLTSELGLEQADNLQTNMTVFDRNIFAQKLVTFMDGRCRGSQ